MKKLFFLLIAILLTSCAGDPQLRPRPPETDPTIAGTWVLQKAELGGKNFVLPYTFELKISGDRFTAGMPPGNDHGKLILFGDELAGQARRMDVVGEDGPNKGKRYPAIYRVISGREMEFCYDLSEKERPTDFVSRAGTLVFRVTYVRK